MCALAERCLGDEKLGRCLFLFLVLSAAFSPTLYAQLSTASVTGIVRDSTGGVIVGANGVLRNVDTGVERTTVSNSAGNYLFLNVNPGRYTLEMHGAGFKSSRVSEFTLAVSQAATFDITLEVGGLEQTVTVGATVAEIESSTAQLGSVVAEKQVVDLPLNGRNFTQLLSAGSWRRASQRIPKFGWLQRSHHARESIRFSCDQRSDQPLQLLHAGRHLRPK